MANQRQIRQVVVPLGMLTEFIDRQTGELTNARLIRFQPIPQTNIVNMYIESDTDHPVPLKLELDWNKIFGTVPCAKCGKMTPVEKIVACEECAV